MKMQCTVCAEEYSELMIAKIIRYPRESGITEIICAICEAKHVTIEMTVAKAKVILLDRELEQLTNQIRNNS